MWNSLAEGVHFCSKCGQVVAAQPVYLRPPMPMYLPRVQRNLQTLGVLWCVLGVYRVVSGLIGMVFLRAFHDAQFWGRQLDVCRHWQWAGHADVDG